MSRHQNYNQACCCLVCQYINYTNSYWNQELRDFIDIRVSEFGYSGRFGVNHHCCGKFPFHKVRKPSIKRSIFVTHAFNACWCFWYTMNDQCSMFVLPFFFKFWHCQKSKFITHLSQIIFMGKRSTKNIYKWSCLLAGSKY